jgi:hypothetical protein
MPDALSDSYWYDHLNNVGEEYRSWSSLCSLLQAPEAYWFSNEFCLTSENIVFHQIKCCTVNLRLTLHPIIASPPPLFFLYWPPFFNIDRLWWIFPRPRLTLLVLEAGGMFQDCTYHIRYVVFLLSSALFYSVFWFSGCNPNVKWGLHLPISTIHFAAS